MKKRRDKKKRKDEKCERRSINRGMLPVQECRRNVSCGGGGGEGRIKASVEFDFRRLSSEEQVNEMVSCFFHLRVKFARVSVFTARCWWTSDGAAHERDERGGSAPSLQNPFAGRAARTTRGNECGHSQAWNVALPAR